MKQLKTGVYIQRVFGVRNWLNILWNFLIGLSGSSFVTNASNSGPIGSVILLLFLPQGLAMYFYGVIGMYITLCALCMLCLDIGAGFNEIDHTLGVMLVFRWGFPGPNRKVLTRFLIRDIVGVRYSPNFFLWKKPYISLALIDGQQFTLPNNIGFQTSEELEMEAVELAKILQVPLEIER